MEEVKQAKNTAEAIPSTGTEDKDRMADATSSETLKDIEETESRSTTNPSSTSAGERSSIPAPDGTPTDAARGGRADGSDNAGPM